VLGAGVLLDLLVAALDGPAAGVAGGGLGSGGGQAGGDEEVVGLLAGGVADDGEPDEAVLADLVPQDVEDGDQLLSGPSAYVDGDCLPRAARRGGGQLGRLAEPGAARAGPTAPAGARRTGSYRAASRRRRAVTWVRGRPVPARVA